MYLVVLSLRDSYAKHCTISRIEKKCLFVEAGNINIDPPYLSRFHGSGYQHGKLIMIAYVEAMAGEIAYKANFSAHAKNEFIVEGIIYMSNS